MSIYLNKDGAVTGPFGESTINFWLNDRKLSLDVLGRRLGEEAWKPLYELGLELNGLPWHDKWVDRLPFIAVGLGIVSGALQGYLDSDTFMFGAMVKEAIRNLFWLLIWSRLLTYPFAWIVKLITRLPYDFSYHLTHMVFASLTFLLQAFGVSLLALTVLAK